MDILLFNPYYSQKKKYYSFYKPTEPLGLMYLAAYLRKFGLESKIFELGTFDIQKAIFRKGRVRFGLSDNKIRQILRREKPKIVGITSMYSVYYGDVMEIAKMVKNFNKRIKVVIGGNHASSYYNFILKDKNIDFVVIGEGERTFLELCRIILKRRKSFRLIKGLAFRENAKVIKTKPRELIADIDEIPFPARDLVDYKKYLAAADNPYVMRFPSAAVITSRGCPGNCVFCTVKAVWGRTWRGRSPKNVVAEIETLVNQWGVREIAFLDDSASVNKNRWNNFCDELIRRNLNIKWTTPNGIAHWTLNKKIISKMYRAGCYRITFGIESGNAKTRRFIRKQHPIKQAKRMIQHANKIGMWTICTNIIGFPYEKMNSIRDTIDFAKKSGTDFASFYLLIPQPTSDVYQCFRQENLLNLDRFFEKLKINDRVFEEINYILNETGCDTKYFKKEELREIQRKAYREFFIYRAIDYFFHPNKVFRKIKNREDLLYLFRLMSLGFKILIRTANPLNLKSSDFIYEKKALKDQS